MWKKIVGWLKDRFHGKKGQPRILEAGMISSAGIAAIVPKPHLRSGSVVTPPETYETINVQVTRMEAGTGSGLCSTGIPLPPGLLQPGETDLVRVTINSVEQQIYIEALEGLHSDGTLRSVLVQFNISCDYGSPLTGTIDAGVGISRGTVDISKTTVSWLSPTIVCLPTDPSYILTTDIVPPTIAVADVPSSPTYLQDYESNFSTWGDAHWNLTAQVIDPDPTYFGYNYYDRALIWLIEWARTGTFKWWYRFCEQVGAWITWADGVPSYWDIAPHNALAEGAARHYWLVGRTDSRYGVRELANYYDVLYDGGYIDAPSGEGRIQARVLEAYVLNHMLADTSKDWAAKALDIVTRTLATQSPDGSYDQFSVQNYQEKPFMSSMVYYDFWMYYTYVDADSRLLPSLKKWMDFIIANMWDPATNSFKYQEDSTSGSPDLNGMIVFCFAWYYKMVGGSTYLTYANNLIQGLNTGAWLYGYKQFNQSYRQSTPYMLWRNG